MEFIDFSGLGRCSGALGEALGGPWSAPEALLGALWAHLELLKPSWRPPRPSWSALGALLDALERSYSALGAESTQTRPQQSN